MKRYDVKNRYWYLSLAVVITKSHSALTFEDSSAFATRAFLFATVAYLYRMQINLRGADSVTLNICLSVKCGCSAVPQFPFVFSFQLLLRAAGVSVPAERYCACIAEGAA